MLLSGVLLRWVWQSVRQTMLIERKLDQILWPRNRCCSPIEHKLRVEWVVVLMRALVNLFLVRFLDPCSEHRFATFASCIVIGGSEQAVILQRDFAIESWLLVVELNSYPSIPGLPLRDHVWFAPQLAAMRAYPCFLIGRGSKLRPALLKVHLHFEKLLGEICIPYFLSLFVFL